MSLFKIKIIVIIIPILISLPGFATDDNSSIQLQELKQTDTSEASPIEASKETLKELPLEPQTLLKGRASANDILPKNTKLKIAVNEELSSEDTQIGDIFTATVLSDLTVNDESVIPVGSIVLGHVADVMRAGKASRQGTIQIAFDKIMLPNGQYIPLNGAKFGVDKKYTNKSRDLKGEGTGLTKGIGLGVLKGATLTFIPGNKAVKTAAIGAAATGAVFSGGWSITSTAVIGGLTGLAYGLKKHGKEVMIASGQEFEIELDKSQELAPVEVAAEDLMDNSNAAETTADSNETVIK